MRVQRYIKYLKPANKKCLISGILVFLCKIRRNGRKKTAAKRDRKGQPISNRENTENLFPLLLGSDLSAKVDLYGLFEFADKDDICEGKDSVVKEIVESINEM